MTRGRPLSDRIYEVRYAWEPIDLLAVPMLCGLVIIGVWVEFVIVREPAASNWWVAAVFGLQLVLVLLLLYRLGWMVDARVALRIDSHGLLSEIRWPAPLGYQIDPWPNVATVELARIRNHGSPPMVRHRYIRLWNFEADRQSVSENYVLYDAKGLKPDRDRIKAVIAHHAPHVRIVDRW